MVMVIVHHTFKDFNAFSSRALDWHAILKPEKGYKYIKTYSALPVKNEAWCIWDIANSKAIADFEKEFSEALGDAGTAEATWVTEFAGISEIILMARLALRRLRRS